MKEPNEIQRAFHHVSNLFEKSHTKGDGERNGYVPPIPAEELSKVVPSNLLRTKVPNFPQLSEVEVVRHFTRLSQLNFGIDSGTYPLGSCTMKYNPRVNERVASEEGFTSLHPYTPEKYAQGALALMYELQQALITITGLKGCSLQPAAGAHGELVGVQMIRAYHRKKGQKQRTTILVPDSAHGTNPASAALCGLKVKQLASGPNGMLEVADVEKAMDDTVAGIMVTVPNTLGIFEEKIIEIASLVHERGGLVYCDGANLNALVGKVDFRAIGVDVMHINLHKTFSTPHGGGGPGAGPVVVSEKLLDFLPIPLVRKRGEDTYFLDDTVSHTIGRFRSFYGNFGVLVRALCYIYAFGPEGISEIANGSVLNANYLKTKLKASYHLPYSTPTLHEAVFTDKWQQANHVSTLDVAKRMMDFGIHPPTVYFPLVVRGALMIEPTETESKEDLDRFVAILTLIAEEAKTNPEKLTGAPHNLGIRRLDETRAAREPILTWNPPGAKPVRKSP
ncbi:MAG: aminomethyl-transferring glycine dehydrogenase subunit GcvPB [Pseudomonadota bacterium]